MTEIFQDDYAIFRFTYNLECYKKALDIKEFYPEKNPHECKIKKEYGNKAYQEGKDIDALHFYTQVCSLLNYYIFPLILFRILETCRWSGFIWVLSNQQMHQFSRFCRLLQINSWINFQDFVGYFS